ncbi:MAG: TonB-dependent receptor [Verrucomicrobium sp.]|nr:TonB-dependent receptor [Verrucomicrobium sp.]
MQAICAILTLLLLVPALRAAQEAAPADAAAAGSPTNAPQLETVTVVGTLDEARQRIVPNTGATVYTVTQDQIQNQSRGDNVSLNQLLLRFPGVTQDTSSDGGLHVRDEHGNVQYRINDVLIPEGITGFGSEFDTRFADRVDLITGSLPAQYGFRTTGIIDIHTKSGAFDPGGDVEMYGGSHETTRPSFEYGGTQGKWDYYVSGSYLQNTMGIENPSNGTSNPHDDTDQYRGFLYASYLIDSTSRLSFLAGESYNHYQIPSAAGQAAATDGAGNPFPGLPAFVDSSRLQNTQDEQNNYEVVAYQKTDGDFDYQLALFNRYSNIFYRPDTTGNLYVNGVSGSQDRSLMSQGLQFDGSWQVADDHTLRSGLMLDAQGAQQSSTTYVFPVDGSGAATGGAFGVPAGDYEAAYMYGFYLQDEWRITKELTLNYGGRFDLYQNGEIHQNQISPRINGTYQLDTDTAFHAGYASYFTPPSLENAPPSASALFAGTDNAATDGLPNDPVKAERDHYFDIGVTHRFTKEYQVGLDAYYKIAQNQLDDGQFGAAPILTQFNYRRAEITGVELSQTYEQKGFSAFANLAVEQARGTGVNSAQSLLFSADDYNYINANSIYLDHNQTFTGSVGASYLINETRPYVEIVCGSGLRADRVYADGSTIPNGDSIPAYDNVNIGFTQTFGFLGCKNLKARFDIVNLFDQVYYLRGDSGVGVFNAEYGARRTFYAGVTYSF